VNNKLLIEKLKDRYLGKVIALTKCYKIVDVQTFLFKEDNRLRSEVSFVMERCGYNVKIDYFFLAFQRNVKDYYGLDTDYGKWEILQVDEIVT
jgi:hypothetical protein